MYVMCSRHITWNSLLYPLHPKSGKGSYKASYFSFVAACIQASRVAKENKFRMHKPNFTQLQVQPELLETQLGKEVNSHSIIL